MRIGFNMDIAFCANCWRSLQTNGAVLRVFDKFLTDNADRMEDLFNQMDKDKSGDVTLEELKFGLKDFGLHLTSVCNIKYITLKILMTLLLNCHHPEPV